MDIVKGGKEKKETIKHAEERRKKVDFVPRNKDVLVDIIDIMPRARDSGLVLPDGHGAESLGINNYWEHPFQGYVVDKGFDAASDIAIGAKVAFRPPGNPIRDKGHTYALLSDYDIIGILE